MSKWTDDELEEFIKLLDMTSSLAQLIRIESRLEMPLFVQKHGKEKCDAMFKYVNDNNL